MNHEAAGGEGHVAGRCLPRADSRALAHRLQCSSGRRECGRKTLILQVLYCRAQLTTEPHDGAALPGDHGKWVQIPRGAATVSGECCFSRIAPLRPTTGVGRLETARRSASQDTWRRAVLFSRRETRRKGAPCVRPLLLFLCVLFLLVIAVPALLCGTGDRPGRRSRWPRRCRARRCSSPTARRSSPRDADRWRRDSSRSTRRTAARSRSASRSTVSAASPSPSPAPAPSRDLGTIALEISAVSESVVVSAAQVEIPLSTASSSVTVITARRSGKTPGRKRGRRAARRAWTVGGRQRRPRRADERLSARRRIGLLARASSTACRPTRSAAVTTSRICRSPTSSGSKSSADRRARSTDRTPSARSFGSSRGRAARRRVGVVRRRRVRYVPRSGRDLGRRRSVALGRVDRTADDRQLQRSAHGERSRSSRTTTTSGTLRRAAGGWRNGAGAGIRGAVRYANDERGSPGPFGIGSGRHLRRHRHDLARRQRPAGCCRLPATPRSAAPASAPRRRTRDSTASSPARSAIRSRTRGGRPRGCRRMRRWRAASRPPRGSSCSANAPGGTFITATGNVLVPVERGVAGFFGEARWNHAARLFVTAGVRIDRITRQALAADAGARAPAVRRATRSSRRTPRSRRPGSSARPTATSPSCAPRRAPASGRRTRSRSHSPTTRRSRPSAARASTPASNRRSSADAGSSRRTSFVNNYDDLIVATGSFSGSSRYRTDNISNARARGVEIAGTARAPLGVRRRQPSGARRLHPSRDRDPGRRRERIGAAAVHRRRSPAPPARSSVLGGCPPLGGPPLGVPPGRRAQQRARRRPQLRHVRRACSTHRATASGTRVRPGRSANHLQLFGRVANLFDRDYEEALGYPALGRSGMVGLRVAASR